MWFRSLGWKDPLGEEMATHSNILAWKFLGQRILVDYSPWGHKVHGAWTEHTHTHNTHTHTHHILQI